MATIVTGEQYMMIDGKLFEIKRQLRQRGGYPFDLERLSRTLQEIVDGRFEAPCVPEAVSSSLPTEMTVGGVTYEILSFLQEEDGGHVSSDVMVERANEMNACLGEEDGQNLFKNWRDIPAVLRRKIFFVLPAWRSSHVPGGVACVHWDDVGWYQSWHWLNNGWGGDGRLLRRK